MMQMFQKTHVVAVAQTAVSVCAATIIAGFWWGGWSLSSTVTKAEVAGKIDGRMSVLAPECARQMVKIPAAMAEIDKESQYNYERVVTKHLPEVAGVKTSEGELGRLCGAAAKELAKKK